MRSSKSRSRSKNNRNRSVGNIMNRVFDSSGPEGKVRGTPQQIIEKYNQLARDAQLGNDPVAAENFMQHAEHYTRLLSAAQREIEARREQQEREQRERQQQRAEQQQARREQQQAQRGDEPRPAAPGADPLAAGQPEILAPIDSGDSDSILVDTPEQSASGRGSARKARRMSENGPQGDAPDRPEAAE